MALVGGGPRQQVSMPALDLRRWVSSLVETEGLRAAGELAVAQKAGGANMSVDIAAGTAVVQGDAITKQGFYLEYNDATFNLTGFAAADSTNPRIDRVGIRARDAYHGDPDNTDAFVIVTGTPTSGATLGNLNGAGAVPASVLLLANVLVPASATTITTGNISNVAPVLRCIVGGVTQTVSTTIAGFGTALDGKTGLLRMGSTPYDFLWCVYDATYGKWVTETVRYPLGAGTNLTASYVTQGAAMLSAAKARQDAGLSIQTRFVSAVFCNNATARTTSAQIVLYEQADGDSALGTARYTSAAFTKATSSAAVFWFSTGWDATAMTTMTKADGYLAFQTKDSVNDGNAVCPANSSPWNPTTSHTQNSMFARWVG